MSLQGHNKFNCPERQRDFKDKKCFICKRVRCKAATCPKAKWNKSKSEKANRATPDDVLLVTKDKMALKSTETVGSFWIANLASSGHMTANKEGMTNVREVDKNIKVANNLSMKATSMGDLRIQMDNSKKTILLRNIWYIPTLGCNLVSVMKATNAGFNLGIDGNVILCKKNDMEIKFDEVIKTKHKHMMAMKATRLSDNEGTNNTALKTADQMDINELHRRDKR